ncbi:MAG: sigma-54 dependent transcriptional regulator [Desulfuromusa sp.]|nr:sigma-54 dependent transcriptional regulator [Desulfuromusa sp.]
MSFQLAHKNLLIIDDDQLFCDAFREDLSDSGMSVLLAHTGADGIRICKNDRIDVVLLDQHLPDAQGVNLCQEILACNDEIKIIFATAYPEFSNAVDAIKAGAYDYLSKPFELEELRLHLNRAFEAQAFERVQQVHEYQSHKDSEEATLVSSNGGLSAVERLIDLAAVENAPVLITGETGSGKNVVAKAIHYRSAYREAPFVSINCASLPETLIEAELFGVHKGAFTGATTNKKGLFEMAEGGTVFLDEIGEMPLHLQAKLLSVLEEKKVRRLGGVTEFPIAVRVIAATNIDLDRALSNKTFREDLYYRLNVLHINLPALRQRPEDIAELCEYFIAKAARGRAIRISSDEVDRLTAYSWPGNVRELKNIIERAVILQQDGIITPSKMIDNDPQPPSTQRSADNRIIPLEDIEKTHILNAFNQLDKNYTHTAKALGIGLSTLKRKLKNYQNNN